MPQIAHIGPELVVFGKRFQQFWQSTEIPINQHLVDPSLARHSIDSDLAKAGRSKQTADGPQDIAPGLFLVSGQLLNCPLLPASLNPPQALPH